MRYSAIGLDSKGALVSGVPVVARAFARAGLLGNPSDGYRGRSIATCVYDFEAKVTLSPLGRYEVATAEPPAALLEASLGRLARRVQRDLPAAAVRPLRRRNRSPSE